MKGMSVFRIVVLIIFGLLAVGGLFAFSTYKGGSNDETIKPAIIWGTLPRSGFERMIQSQKTAKEIFPVTYVEKNSLTFEHDLLESLAEGKGPDIIVLSDEMVVKYAQKIVPYPYTNFPERDFRDSYTQASEIFLSPGGVLAIPFAIDPLVMYWNRTILSNAGITKPPSDWTALAGFAEKISRRDKALNITRSAVAFGEYDNITNAKDIIISLMLQTGNQLVKRNGATLKSAIAESSFPIPLVFDFYTQFSNPTLPIYSWNRALPNSREMFLSGDLAIYFGFGSELANLRNLNPNLDFDVAPFPQRELSEVRAVAGRVYGLAVLKGSSNPLNAFQVISKLVVPSEANELSTAINLPPARRDALAIIPTDSIYRTLFHRSSVFVRTWHNPESSILDSILNRSVGAITSGSQTSKAVVDRANQEIDNALAGIELP
jgi:multiple sugar transport system substrate-binding protein